MDKQRGNDRLKGILFIIASAFFFSLMSVFVRMAGDLPTMQKALFRNAVAAAYAWIMLARTNEKFHIMKGNLPDLLKRSIFGILGVIANFWAIDHLTIADAGVLNKMSPFFAILLSIVILGERVSRVEWIAVIIAFLGSLLVIKPTTGIASLPAFVGLFSGFCAGAAYTYVRKLGTRGERGMVIVMFFSTFSVVVLLPFVIMDFQPMTMTQVLVLLGAGTAAMGGQVTITKAYTYTPAKTLSVFDYTNVIFASIWGFTFFGEIPDALSVAGYVIIISMAIVKWRHAMKGSE